MHNVAYKWRLCLYKLYILIILLKYAIFDLVIISKIYTKLDSKKDIMNSSFNYVVIMYLQSSRYLKFS